MQAIEIKVYDIFRTKIGEKEAEIVMEYFETKAESKINDFIKENELAKKQLASKDDIRSLEIKLEQSKTDILRQMYITNLLQLLAIIGSVVAIVKYMR